MKAQTSEQLVGIVVLIIFVPVIITLVSQINMNTQAQKDLETYKTQLQSCGESVSEFRNQTIDLNNQLINKQTELDICLGNLTDCRDELNLTQEQLAECEQNLQEQSWLNVFFFFVREYYVVIYIFSIAVSFTVGIKFTLKIIIKRKVTKKRVKDKLKNLIGKKHGELKTSKHEKEGSEHS